MTFRRRPGKAQGYVEHGRSVGNALKYPPRRSAMKGSESVPCHRMRRCHGLRLRRPTLSQVDSEHEQDG